MIKPAIKPSTVVLVESALFMSVLTFIGGYINAYSYLTRGGVFANNQTGNMALLGLHLFNRDFSAAVSVLLPILATLLGAFISEHIRVKGLGGGNFFWQRTTLLIEGLALAVIGVIPVTVPHWITNLILAFIAAFQLSNFRAYEGWVHNSTICTGNLRTMGQSLYLSLFVEKNEEYRGRTRRYFFVLISFVVGCFTGALFCQWIGIKSIWLCLPLLVWLYILHHQSAHNCMD